MPRGKSKSMKSVSKEINKSTDLAVNSIGSLSEGFLKSLMETSNVAELILNSIHNLIYGIGHNEKCPLMQSRLNTILTKQQCLDIFGKYVK